MSKFNIPLIYQINPFSLEKGFFVRHTERAKQLFGHFGNLDVLYNGGTMQIKSVSFLEKPVSSVYLRPKLDFYGWLIVDYQPVPYLAKEFAGVLESEEKNEVERLVNSYLWFCGVRTAHGVYLRLDCYITEDRAIHVLEINSLSTDGWGPAWHLARISGNPINIDKAYFPQFWTTFDSRFAPALELVCQELALSGRAAEVISWEEALTKDEPVYGYLQNSRKDYPSHFAPRYAYLEDKLSFAKFSREWQGLRIRIPRHYWHETDYLRSLRPRMGSIVFKPRIKDSASNKESVVFTNSKNSPVDVVDALEYLRGDVIAQDMVKTVTVNNEPVQAILLFAPTQDFKQLTLAGGYLQIATPKIRIINDMAAHAPLHI